MCDTNSHINMNWINNDIKERKCFTFNPLDSIIDYTSGNFLINNNACISLDVDFLMGKIK